MTNAQVTKRNRVRGKKKEKRKKEREIKKRKQEEKEKLLARSCNVRARQLKNLRMEREKLEKKKEQLQELAASMKPEVDNNIYLAAQVLKEVKLAVEKFEEVKACVKDVQKQGALACSSYVLALDLALAKAEPGDAEQIRALRAVGKPLAGIANVAGSCLEAIEKHTAKAMEYAERADMQAIRMGVLLK